MKIQLLKDWENDGSTYKKGMVLEIAHDGVVEEMIADGIATKEISVAPSLPRWVDLHHRDGTIEMAIISREITESIMLHAIAASDAPKDCKQNLKALEGEHPVYLKVSLASSQIPFIACLLDLRGKITSETYGQNVETLFIQPCGHENFVATIKICEM